MIEGDTESPLGTSLAGIFLRESEEAAGLIFKL